MVEVPTRREFDDLTEEQQNLRVGAVVMLAHPETAEDADLRFTLMSPIESESVQLQEICDRQFKPIRFMRACEITLAD
jgi:hypothetical protein